MALLFADSFDHYTNLNVKWTNSAGALITSVSARNGPAGCTMGDIYKTLPLDDAFVVGFAMRVGIGSGFPAWGGEPYVLSAVNIFGGLSNLFKILVLPDATLALYAGDSTLMCNPTTFSLVSGSWFYIEAKFSLGGSGSSLVAVTGELRVNGHVLGSGGGNANTVVNQLVSQLAKGDYHGFHAGNGGTGRTDMDDIYINNQTAVSGQPVASTYRGDVRVGPGIYPASDDHITWGHTGGSGSSNFTRLNENPPDNDTTFTSDDTVSDYDTFGFDTVASFAGEIQAAHFGIYARKDNEGERSIVPVVGTSGASEGPEIFLNDTYFYHFWPMDQDPTAGNWTVAGINAEVFGVKVKS